MTTFLSILVLGFFLGMRHATDPDHVIAVTTIVSRQRDIRNAAITGVFGASVIASRFWLSAAQSFSLDLSFRSGSA